jgi:hypothetical protein
MRAMGAKSSSEALHRATEQGLLNSSRKLDK